MECWNWEVVSCQSHRYFIFMREIRFECFLDHATRTLGMGGIRIRAGMNRKRHI